MQSPGDEEVKELLQKIGDATFKWVHLDRDPAPKPVDLSSLGAGSRCLPPGLTILTLNSYQRQETPLLLWSPPPLGVEKSVTGPASL